MKKFLFVLCILVVSLLSCVSNKGGNTSTPISSGNIGDKTDTVGVIKYQGVFLNLHLSPKRWYNGDKEYWRRGFPSNVPAWSFGDKKKKTIVTCLFFENGIGSKENFLSLVRAELRAFNKNMPRKSLPMSVEDFVNSYTVENLTPIVIDGVQEVILETVLDCTDKPFRSQITFFSYKRFFFMIHNQTGYAGSQGHQKELTMDIIPNFFYKIFPYIR